MKKKYAKTIPFAFVTSLLVGLSTLSTAKAVDVKLPIQCEKLFTETEKLIAEAEKQPGTHTQLSKIKSKLNQSKQQILEMELATQVKSCDLGLAKLNAKQQPDE